MTENNARYNGKANFEEWRKEWALEDRYNFHTIEKKWQKIWDDEKAYKVEIDHDKEKFYALVEFPYPSGAGLHVGHPRSYTALDVIARKKRMQGFNVLYPMGFDAFGLPAENYAIKTGVHPAVSTQANIKTFTKQLKSLGFSFDWDRCGQRRGCQRLLRALRRTGGTQKQRTVDDCDYQIRRSFD